MTTARMFYCAICVGLLVLTTAACAGTPPGTPAVSAAPTSSRYGGTPFDTFSRSAHTANAAGPTLERRLRLKRLMESEGFVNYAREWWHYSYAAPNAVRFDRVIH